MLRCAFELLTIGLGFPTRTAFVLRLSKRLVSHSLALGDSSEGLFANPSIGSASKSRAKTNSISILGSFSVILFTE